MTVSRKVAAIAATTTLAIAATLAISAADAVVATADARHGAASAWSSGDADAGATKADAQLLAPLAADLDGGTLDSPSAGRSIQVDAVTRVAVVATSSGALCTLHEVRSELVTRGCFEDFALDGTAVSYAIGGGDAASLVGPVAHDVTAVSIDTADGQSHDLRIVDGAVAWTGAPDARIVRMTTVRGGERHVETKRFVLPTA